MQYCDAPEFAHLYLEDSFVLGLQAEPNSVLLTIEFVLHESHPQYQSPSEDEQYRYRRGRIRFEGVRSFTWRMPQGPPATDATGEADFGGLELYEILEGRHRFLGEIGEVLITCDSFAVEFAAD